MSTPRHTARCRSENCRAPIEWAVVAKSGSGVPLDAEPNPDGGCFVVDHAEDGRPIIEYITGMLPAPEGAEVRSSHFETCPDAQSFSKSKGAKR